MMFVQLMMMLMLGADGSLLQGEVEAAAQLVPVRAHTPALFRATGPAAVARGGAPVASANFAELATALQEKRFRDADDLTRQALINLAGPSAIQRGYVYFSEVPDLPVEDMAEIERLWRDASDQKFGFVAQRKIFNSKKINKDIESFFRKIDWQKPDGSLRTWSADADRDTFIYDMDGATGHLPLTNTLRGTRLLRGLLEHKAWDLPEFALERCDGRTDRLEKGGLEESVE
jgi:hypothetical protein